MWPTALLLELIAYLAYNCAVGGQVVLTFSSTNIMPEDQINMHGKTYLDGS